MNATQITRNTLLHNGRIWIHIERYTAKGWREQAYEKAKITPASRKRLMTVVNGCVGTVTTYRNGDWSFTVTAEANDPATQQQLRETGDDE